MVDTIKIRLGDVELSPNPDLRLWPGTLDMKTGELYETILAKTTDGNVIMGAKAGKNTEDFQLTLDKFGFSVQTSLPKLASDNGVNFFAVDGRKAKETFDKLELLLANVGVKTKLVDAKLMWLHLFKNGEMQYSPLYYYPILQAFPGGCRATTTDYGSGIKFENNNRQVVFYDKNREIFDKHKLIPSNIPKNVLRGEMRLLDKRTIKREMKLETVKSLMGEWNGLEGVYRKNVRALVFGSHINKNTIAKVNGKVFLSDIEKLRHYKQRAGRNTWNYVKGRYGLDEFANRYNRRQFEEMIKTLLPRITAMRAVREFVDAQMELGIFNREDVTTADLLEELYKKVG